MQLIDRLLHQPVAPVQPGLSPTPASRANPLFPPFAPHQLAVIAAAQAVIQVKLLLQHFKKQALGESNQPRRVS